MSYKDKPQIKLYKYENSAFILQAIIDDFQEISFERNLYQAGTFTISINYNIPNALLFERGMFVQFGNDPYDFGEIITITDTIGADGKGSQIRTITGYDSRYILKRRVIKNMNSNGLWSMTAKGELCLRNLVKDQCGSSAESKRQLPIINTIPASADAIGKEYSVSEQFTNLYEVCKTIATQSEIGWRLAFDGTSLTLECYEGTDRSQTVQFSTSFDSLANGEFSDSSESFSNAIYVGGKGDNEERDIYEGENGTPSGLDRFESFDNQSSMTTESEYEAEALSMLTQYGQTIQMSGNGLAKCPYIYKEQYDVGDLITVAFSGKSAVVQILSVTEHWTWGNYNIQFSFGKPQNNLSEQLQLMLRKIQSASNKEKATESVKWYNVANVNSMSASDVTFNTIGFTGTLTANKTFTFYLDDEKTGAKSYNIYVKNLSGNFNLTLTTGRSGKTNYVLKGGVNLTGRILVDDEGNITSQSVTATSVIESGNNQPATSGGVADAIQGVISLPTDAVLHYSFDEVPDYPDGTAVYFRNQDFSLSDGWAGGSNVLTVPNGILTVSNVATTYIYKPISITNPIVRCKIRTSVDDTINLYCKETGGVQHTIATVNAKANEAIEIVGNINITLTAIGFAGFDLGTKFEVLTFYIGNGSYSTPIIDNANGQNNATNNGGIAVQGVSGKGLYGIGRRTILTNSNFPKPTDKSSITLSGWVKHSSNYNDAGTRNLFGIGAYNGTFCIMQHWATGQNSMRVTAFVRQDDTHQRSIGVNVTKNEWHHFAMVWENKLLTFYVDGIKYTTSALDVSDFTFGGTSWRIGDIGVVQGVEPSETGNIEYYVDDVQIFDRALSENEVMALYLNKANTPKYYDINNYNLKQIKDITAQSTDFADFQSRMAGLATRSLQLIEPTEDER
jgi:hypothetical protein